MKGLALAGLALACAVLDDAPPASRRAWLDLSSDEARQLWEHAWALTNRTAAAQDHQDECRRECANTEAPRANPTNPIALACDRAAAVKATAVTELWASVACVSRSRSHCVAAPIVVSVAGKRRRPIETAGPIHPVWSAEATTARASEATALARPTPEAASVVAFTPTVVTLEASSCAEGPGAVTSCGVRR